MTKKLIALIALSTIGNTLYASPQPPEPFSSSVGSWSNTQISENGRYIAAGIGPVIHDQKTRTTNDPEVNAGMFMTTHGFSLSDDGRFIAFTPKNSNTSVEVESDSHQDSEFIDVYLRDLETGKTELVSAPNDTNLAANGRSLNPQVSRNGKFVAFMSEGNNFTDDDSIPEGNATQANLYLYNREKEKISHLAHDYKGYKSTSSGSFPDISANGQFILYDSSSSSSPSTLINRKTGEHTEIASKTGVTATVTHSELSNDGRYALIQHHYHTTNHAELQLFDRKTGTSELISVSTNGANEPVTVPTEPLPTTQFDMSGDGRYIAFSSSDNGITENANNGLKDTFVYDRREHEVRRLNVDQSGQRLDPSEVSVSISEDGHYITFNNYVVANPLFDADYCEGYEPL